MTIYFTSQYQLESLVVWRVAIVLACSLPVFFACPALSSTLPESDTLLLIADTDGTPPPEAHSEPPPPGMHSLLNPVPMKSKKPTPNPAPDEVPTRSLLALAFRDDDLRVLLNSAHLGTCQVSLRALDLQFRAEVSYRPPCVASMQRKAFEPRSVEASPPLPKPAPMNSDDLGLLALQRVATRSLSSYFSTNTAIRNLIEGRVSLDVSVDAFFSKTGAGSSDRPRYILSMAEPPPGSDPYYEPYTAVLSAQRTVTSGVPMQAAANPTPGSLPQIVEYWPPEPLPSAPPPPLTLTEDNDPRSTLARFLLLKEKPFSRFRLTLERRNGRNFEDGVFVKLEEGLGLLSGNVSPLLLGRWREISVHFKIPYLFHSLHITYPDLTHSPTLSYVYLNGEKARFQIDYNLNTESYVARMALLF